MSNSSGQFEDQAYELRQRMHDKGDDQVASNSLNEEDDAVMDEGGLDVLDLPPRSKVHKDKDTGFKWKMQYPLLRFLLAVFVLLIISILLYNVWTERDNTNSLLGSKTTQAMVDNKSTYVMELSRSLEPKVTKEVQKEPVEVNKDSKSSEFLTKSTDAKDVDQDTKNSELPTEEAVTNNQDEAKSSPKKQEQSFIYYKVKKGDTLFSVAMKYYNSKAGEDIIKKANNIKSEGIFVGQVLKIPQK